MKLKTSLNTPAKRFHRRLLIVFFYSLVLLGGILSTTRFDPGFYGGFILAIVFIILLFLSTAGIMVMPSEKLDERQQRLQNLTFRSSYRILTGLIIVTFLVANTSHWLTSVSVAALISIATALVLLLPVTLVGWTEPDPIDDEAPPKRTRKLA